MGGVAKALKRPSEDPVLLDAAINDGSCNRLPVGLVNPLSWDVAGGSMSSAVRKDVSARSFTLLVIMRKES